MVPNQFYLLWECCPSGFLPGIFSGGMYCYANFSIVFRPILRGKGPLRGQTASGRAPPMGES